MTPEEKNALVQFMGTIYGESKKNDDMLVGQSTNLRPKSGEIKRQVEQVLRAPAAAGAQQPQQAPPSAPVAQPQVTPEQAAQELAQVTPQPVTPQPVSPQQPPHVEVDPNQMEFDLSEPTKLDKLIELIENQNKILLEIRDNSIKSKYNAKRAKNKKPQ